MALLSPCFRGGVGECNTVERVSMMGVLGTLGGFAVALFQGWDGRVQYCCKMYSSNFSFRNKVTIFLRVAFW